MERNKIVFKTTDEYIAGFPKDVQTVLGSMRKAIKQAAPDSEEKISYQMPAFFQNGILVWYAAYKNHIGFYPKTSAIEAFKEELSGYKCSKGTVQFPINKPLPIALIKKIVKFRIAENSAVKAKKKR